MFVFSHIIDNKILRKAVEFFGERNQEDVAIEEMSELTKALIKNRRYNNHKTRADVREEMADVFIMLNQLCIIYGFDEQIVNDKIGRLNLMIEREVQNNIASQGK